MRSKGAHSDLRSAESEAALAEHLTLDFQDPQVTLSLLEADQVVAAKRRTRFGKRKLSLGARMLLWGLRAYVAVMLVIVLFSVLRTLRLAH